MRRLLSPGQPVCDETDSSKISHEATNLASNPRPVSSGNGENTEPRKPGTPELPGGSPQELTGATQYATRSNGSYSDASGSSELEALLPPVDSFKEEERAQWEPLSGDKFNRQKNTPRYVAFCRLRNIKRETDVEMSFLASRCYAFGRCEPLCRPVYREAFGGSWFSVHANIKYVERMNSSPRVRIYHPRIRFLTRRGTFLFTLVYGPGVRYNRNQRCAGTGVRVENCFVLETFAIAFLTRSLSRQFSILKGVLVWSSLGATK